MSTGKEELKKITDELQKLMSESKEFNIKNKEVFDEAKRYKTLIKELRAQVLECMKKNNMKKYDEEGLNLNIRETKNVVFSEGKLSEYMDKKRLSEYIDENSKTRNTIVIKKQRK